MPRFKKGESGNPDGRPKGARNRTTAEMQRALLKLIDENIDQLAKDMKQLSPYQRATLMVALAKHIIPPATETTYTVSNSVASQMTDDELKAEIKRLLAITGIA